MILPYQRLRDIVRGKAPMIVADKPVADSQIQPATLDCRLGSRIYHTRTSMLPKRGERIEDLIKKYLLFDFELKHGSLLEKGACYIIPLQERCILSESLSAFFSPKSSTGRTDVFVRVLSDGNPCYDAVPAGYRGNMYAEVIPLSFPVAISPNLELTQMRIRTENRILSTRELEVVHAKHALVRTNSGAPVDKPVIENDGIYFHVDLTEREIVGWEARGNAGQIDLFRKGEYDAKKFWHPIERCEGGEMILEPGKFYLLASKERVTIPPEYAAEIAPYDTGSGEFRSHYAGFFDPGFGGADGTNVVLEVRVRDVPFRIYDGQPICKMIFEPVTEIPEKLYGEALSSNYIGKGPSLSKHFKKHAW